MQPKSSTGSRSGTKIENDISTAVLALSKGEIVSFGDVAAKAGHPKAARAAGAVLAKSGDALPWWRVVYADGQVPPCNPSDLNDQIASKFHKFGNATKLGLFHGHCG